MKLDAKIIAVLLMVGCIVWKKIKGELPGTDEHMYMESADDSDIVYPKKPLVASVSKVNKSIASQNFPSKPEIAERSSKLTVPIKDVIQKQPHIKHVKPAKTKYNKSGGIFFEKPTKLNTTDSVEPIIRKKRATQPIISKEVIERKFDR